MRFDDGARVLDEVGIHLTSDEARRLIEELTTLVAPGSEGTHGRLGELRLRVYPDTAQLEATYLETLGPAVWVGLVQVEATPESELREHGVGAYATAASLAATSEDYERRVTEHLASEGMKVVGFDDVEPLAARRRAAQVSDKTLELARAAGESGEVECDTFYVFSEEGEDDDEDGSGSIPVLYEGDIETVVADVEGWARGWLGGALERYRDGFTIESIGVAFGLRTDEDGAEVGYACSADTLEAHAELFAAVLAMVESHTDEETDDPA